MMTELAEVLKRIDLRLANIEHVLAAPKLAELISRPRYSCSEMAKLSEMYGVKKYRPFTVRLACKDRRIPDAEKLEDGSWAIPRQAVLRILEEGIPPERRNGSGSATDAEPV